MPPTFILAALKRYIASQAFRPSDSYRNPDELAGRLLLWPLQILSRALGALLRLVPPMRRWMGSFFSVCRTGSLTARTLFFDESIRTTSAEGAEQLVILGAGLDTRAKRLKGFLRGVRVFELDLPKTQSAKRFALERAGLSSGWGATFVPADFEAATWPQALRDAGCDLDNARTHVIWEGCTYYLTGAAVAATLQELRRPGVSLSFDFMDVNLLNSYPHPDAARFASILRRLGEPWIFGIEFYNLHEWAASHGWQVVDAVCGSNQVSERFFPTPEPGHEPYPFMGLATIQPNLDVAG